MATSFEPGRSFINHHDFQDQLDDWFDTRANRRLHRTLRRRPLELLAEELEVMRPLPERTPKTERRWVLRVPPDPHVDRRDATARRSGPCDTVEASGRAALAQ